MQPFELVADPLHHPPAARARVRAGRFIWRALNCLFNSILRVMVFAVYMLLQRPLGTPLAAFCVWASLQVGANLLGQEKPHPSPLFPKQKIEAKTLPSLPAKLFEASYQEDTAADIREAQGKLAELGLYKGALDGRMGPRTAEAVRNFQQRINLEATGIVDAQLLARLRDGEQAAAHETDSILIFTVQHRLNELGYDAGAENGRLSGKTQSAIRKFETDNGLPVTGAIRGLLLSALTSAKLAAKQ